MLDGNIINPAQETHQSSSKIAGAGCITALVIKYLFLSVALNNLGLDGIGCNPSAQIIPISTGLIVEQRMVFFGILQQLFEPHKALQGMEPNGFKKQIVLAAITGCALRHKSNIFRING